jgi:hypothetical protein
MPEGERSASEQESLGSEGSSKRKYRGRHSKPRGDSPAGSLVPAASRRLLSTGQQRIGGILGIMVGLVGLLFVLGSLRYAFSAIAALGLLFALAPLPWDNSRMAQLSIVMAAIGTFVIPAIFIPSLRQPSAAAASCNGRATGQPQLLSLQPFDSSGSANFLTPNASSGYYQVSYPYYEWAGFQASLPYFCTYKVTLQAREVGLDPSQGASGWGYAIGACSYVSDGMPHGLSVQDNYATVNQNVHYFSQVLFESPDSAYRRQPRLALYIDKRWHRWEITVNGNYWSVTYDGHALLSHELFYGASPLPHSCANSGLVFRVWGGTAQFKSVELS